MLRDVNNQFETMLPDVPLADLLKNNAKSVYRILLFLKIRKPLTFTVLE